MGPRTRLKVGLSPLLPLAMLIGMALQGGPDGSWEAQ